MLEVMEKVRTVLMVDDEVRDTLRLESALSGKDMAEVVEELVRTHLADSLAQIRTRRAKAGEKKQPKPPKEKK